MNPEAARPLIAIRDARAADVPTLLSLIRDLAAYEKLLDEVEVTEARLRETLFPLGAPRRRPVSSSASSTGRSPVSRSFSSTIRRFSGSRASILRTFSCGPRPEAGAWGPLCFGT